MWKLEITVEVSLDILTYILTILMDFIKIFIMKCYDKHVIPFFEKFKIFCFSATNVG